MLSVEGVAVHFGGVQALDDVSLQARAGAVTGLIGPNGAGKTTLFNVVSGLQRPDRGRVLLGDQDITSLDPARRAKLGVARTFQRLEIFSSMTARDNILVAAELHRRRPTGATDPQATTDEILHRLRLEPVAAIQAGTLPTGLARLVELGRALATQPSVLLLDEPGSGLSTAETDELAEVLVELARSGMAVLLVEHDIDLVMTVCEQVSVLDGGRVVVSGDPATVQADANVRRAYLGEVAPVAPVAPNDTEDGARSGAEPAESRASTSSAPAREPGRAAGHGPGAPIELAGVRAGYGGIEVLHGIDLSVVEGSVFALLGPNGAGKSTLIKVIAGRLPATHGRIRIGGTDLGHQPAARRARTGLCCVPEGRAVFPNLTVSENLQMWTFRGPSTERSAVEEQAFSRFPILGTRRNQLAGTLSGGEQQMLAMSRALTTDPGVLLLDEISMGLAPRIVAELYDVVGNLAASGITILLVEQFAQMALAIADRAGIMRNGRLTTTGTPEEVSGVLADAYLGIATGAD